jgi:hypothetical protein
VGCEEFEYEYRTDLTVSEMFGLYICIDKYIYEHWSPGKDPADLALEVNRKFNIYERKCDPRVPNDYYCWRADAMRNYILKRVHRVIGAVIEHKARGR